MEKHADAMWGAAEIAAYLLVSKSTVLQRIVTRHDFPPPCLPLGARGRKIWVARDVGAWTERLRPIKQDVAAYLELAALVAHYCAAIKSQLGKPYAPDDAQELLHGACQQPAAARAEIVAYMRREAGRLGKPFAPLSGDAINDKREG